MGPVFFKDEQNKSESTKDKSMSMDVTAFSNDQHIVEQQPVSTTALSASANDANSFYAIAYQVDRSPVIDLNGESNKDRGQKNPETRSLKARKKTDPPPEFWYKSLKQRKGLDPGVGVKGQICLAVCKTLELFFQTNDKGWTSLEEFLLAIPTTKHIYFTSYVNGGYFYSAKMHRVEVGVGSKPLSTLGASEKNHDEALLISKRWLKERKVQVHSVLFLQIDTPFSMLSQKTLSEFFFAWPYPSRPSCSSNCTHGLCTELESATYAETFQKVLGCHPVLFYQISILESGVEIECYHSDEKTVAKIVISNRFVWQ